MQMYIEQKTSNKMARVYIVNNESIADEPFDCERTDLPHHDGIDEYDLRVRLTMYCEEHDEHDEPNTIYPSFEMTPTHTQRVKTHFALMEFPARAFEITPILAWVQIVSYAELQKTIGGIAPKCGEEMIQCLNEAAHVNATHLFSNRYDKTTLMPRCLHWLGKGWSDDGGEVYTVVL